MSSLSSTLKDRPDLSRQLQDEQQRTCLVQWAIEEVLELAAPIWHWGDGYGGYVYELIRDEARRVGLDVGDDLSWSPTSLRLGIFERDAYRCQLCGEWHDLTIDHIIPKSRGGLTVLDNLQTLCRSCNSRKGARMP